MDMCPYHKATVTDGTFDPLAGTLSSEGNELISTETLSLLEMATVGQSFQSQTVKQKALFLPFTVCFDAKTLSEFVFNFFLQEQRGVGEDGFKTLFQTTFPYAGMSQ